LLPQEQQSYLPDFSEFEQAQTKALVSKAVSTLTPREQEVLDLIGRGLTDRQIATNLGLSYETARTYVKTVRRKLGSKNRLTAAAWSWGRQPAPPQD
jgi:RNA polymerase sigma factor (sigma-70 family)